MGKTKTTQEMRNIGTKENPIPIKETRARAGKWYLFSGKPVKTVFAEKAKDDEESVECAGCVFQFAGHIDACATCGAEIIFTEGPEA